jgi:hypothetical protein
LAGQDVTALPRSVQKQVGDIKRFITDAKLDVRDYEFSETRVEQLVHIKQARQRFDQIKKLILAASEYNVFSSIDVAALSAHIEQIVDELA